MGQGRLVVGLIRPVVEINMLVVVCSRPVVGLDRPVAGFIV